MKFRAKVCVLIFAIIAAKCLPAVSAPMKVTVGKVQGTVQVKDGAAWKNLKDGDAVPSGAEIKTGAGSSCVLKWAGGNVVKVGPMTNMSVTADKTGAHEKSKVDIKNGKVSAHAKKLGTESSSFNVTTPTAVAGVRGTDIIAEIAAGNVSFGVSDGQLEVTVGGQTFVLEDGFLLEVDPAGAVTPPIAIPPVMLQELKQEFEEIKAEAAQDEAAGGNDEDSEDEAASDEDSDTDEDMDDDQGGDFEDSDVADSIDDILDNEITNDILDAAGEEYITGGLEIILILDPQAITP